MFSERCKLRTIFCIAIERFETIQTILQIPGGSVRGERANLKGLVLGCIEAKVCKKICVGISYLLQKKIEKKGLSPRSTAMQLISNDLLKFLEFPDTE